MSFAVPAAHSNSGYVPLFRETRNAVRRLAALLTLISLFLASGAHDAQAGPKPTNISVTPVIQSISVQNGQLVATGIATSVIHGQTVSAPFTAPVDIGLAPDQSAAAAAGCPILDLHLGPINLNLLGLVVQTSPICLTVTAYQGGGLLGDLLCGVADLLGQGLSLNQILAGLTSTQLTSLTSGLTNLLNAALGQLINAVLTGIDAVNSGHTCAILHLALGPLDLTLLGLNVHLDNCADGPVTVDITAVTGKGNLLGNLLCGLLDGNLLGLGATLQQILGLLQGLLTA